MKPETKVRISEKINSILSEKNISQNQLSRKAGVSSAHLINMRNEDKWSFVSDKAWQKASAFFNIEKDWLTFTTKNFQHILNVCEDAKDNARLMAIAGKSGYGKTTALKHFVRNNQNAFYVLVNDILSRKAFLKSVAFALHIDTNGNTETLLRNIVIRLNSLENPLLIIDDCGKINDGNYRNIQLLYDETEGKAGIVMAGTMFLKEYIFKMAFKGKMGFDELKRRIEYWLVLDVPKRDEVKAICKHNSITDEDCVNYLCNVIKDFGTLRTLIASSKRYKAGITVELLMQLNAN